MSPMTKPAIVKGGQSAVECREQRTSNRKLGNDTLDERPFAYRREEKMTRAAGRGSLFTAVMTTSPSS